MKTNHGTLSLAGRAPSADEHQRQEVADPADLCKDHCRATRRNTMGSKCYEN